jgi:hypothetical protein
MLRPSAVAAGLFHIVVPVSTGLLSCLLRGSIVDASCCGLQCRHHSPWWWRLVDSIAVDPHGKSLVNVG